MQIGPYKVNVLLPEFFYLDGGAMFAAIPKVLWSRRLIPDEKNRLRLACRCLLLQSGERRIMIDAGCGRDWGEKQQDIFSFEPQFTTGLAQAVPEVSDVVLTHLHFDHSNGLLNSDHVHDPQLVYPKAQYFVQRRHWEHAHSPSLREKPSFDSRTLNALANSSLSLLEGAGEIFPGVQLFTADGHTKGLQWILIGQGREAIAFASELVPTSHHLSESYVMGFDICAETTMREKAEFLRMAALEGWVVVFDHDPDIAAARIGLNTEGRYEIVEKVDIPHWLPRSESADA